MSQQIYFRRYRSPGARSRWERREQPPEEAMPTLVTSREGENCEAKIYGNVLELDPRRYTSAGVTLRFWYFGAGFDHVVPGTTYLVRCPLDGAAQSGIRSAEIAVSHDGKSPSDWSKVWSFPRNGTRTETHREWLVTAQSTKLDISAGLPATWSMVDSKLFDDWAAHVDFSDAATFYHEVARTPPAVDQHGLHIPEQVQRLYRFGSGPLKVFLCCDMHAGEQVGSRTYIHVIDALLEDFPQLLNTCTFVCTHTLNPGRYRSHNRGYAVGAGSDDPNRQWGQNEPSTPFITAMEDALRIDGNGTIEFDAAIDCHGGYSIRQQLWYPKTSRGLEFHAYIDTYDPGLLRNRLTDLNNSTQNAAIEQWGAQIGMTVEIGGITRADTDADLLRYARNILGGLELAIADGFFNEQTQSGVLVDNRDAVVERVGNWNESSAPDEFSGSSEYCGTSPTKGCAGSFTFPVDALGSHYVEVWYTWHPNRSAHVRYTVRHAGGEDEYVVDQTDVSKASQWLRLAMHAFDGPGEIVVHCTEGQASADAVRLLPVMAPPSTTLVEDIEELQVLADQLLQETGSTLAQDMVDGLSALRQRALNEDYM